MHTKFLHRIVHKTGQNVESSATNGFSAAGMNSVAECISIGADIMHVALPVVPVLVRAPDTHTAIPTYALLDTGSTNSFCSQRIANQLHLKGCKQKLSLTTLEKTSSKVLTSAVNLEVMDLSDQVISMKNVFTSHKLPVPTNAIPDADDISRWPHLRNLRLPKLHYCTVELLIGQDVPEALVPREIVSGSPGAPYAVKSSLGQPSNAERTSGKCFCW
jgi:hypothetical protein